MGQTERMIWLLGELRRQMNGAVADSMYYYGTRYGLNYGVSLPTIRSIAAQEPQNNDLALYLYKQDVRELRIAALHIADPQDFAATKELWKRGITTSEIAEELSFALLSKVDEFSNIYDEWSVAEQELVVYAALMAAARRSDFIGTALNTLPSAVERYPSSHIIAQGVIAVMASALSHQHGEATTSILEQLPEAPIKEYIVDEISWRME